MHQALIFDLDGLLIDSETIYRKTITALGLHPDECIVMEDSSNGALSGHRSGCYVIAVPGEYTRNQDFSFADHVAKDLFEARMAIEALLGIAYRR